MSNTNNPKQIAFQSALSWFVVFIAFHALSRVSMLFVSSIGPDIATILSTFVRLIGGMVAIFLTGYTIGKQVTGNTLKYAVLGSGIVIIMMLIMELLPLIFISGFGEAMQTWLLYPLFSLIRAVFFLGLCIGAAVLGGFIGQRAVKK